MLGSIRRSLAVATVVAAGLVSQVQKADATPAGSFLTPRTDIYGEGTLHLDVDAVHYPSPASDTYVSTGLTYGLGPGRDGFMGRSEIGFDFLAGVPGFFDRFDFGYESRVSFNFKTQLYNNTDRGIRFVAGGLGLGNRELNPNSFYLMGSKDFGDIGRLNLGISTLLNKRFKYFGASSTGLFVNYTKFLGDKVQLTLDVSTAKIFSASGAKPLLSGGVAPGLVYYLNDRSNIAFGVLRSNIPISPRTSYYIGYDTNFYTGPNWGEARDENRESAPSVTTPSAGTTTNP